MWCIPPEQNAEFVCAMENVLDLHTRPFDAQRLVVCMDEKSRPFVAEICKPIAARLILGWVNALDPGLHLEPRNGGNGARRPEPHRRKPSARACRGRRCAG
jgi:hypothetical protein